DDAVVLVHLGGLAHQVDGDLGRDDLVAAHDHEVDVVDGALHRMTLEVAGHGQMGFAVDVHGDQGVEAGVAGEGVAQLAAVDGQGHRVGAVAVQHGRHLAGGAQAARGPATDGSTDLCGECDFFHGRVPHRVVRRSIVSLGGVTPGFPLRR